MTTTNDGTRALRPGAVTAARKSKPEISELGEGGIPVGDEIELTMELP